MSRSTPYFHAIVLLFCILWGRAVAQDTTRPTSPLTLKAFIDAYYAYDFNKPANHQKPTFLYNHTRHNELTVNLALLGVSYNDSSKRASLGLMAGTYAQYNMAAEPELLRAVYEASAGIKVSRQHEVWVDVGILPSHIGFETPVSSENATLTRSIAAENSPYYEAGIRLSWKDRKEKWYASFLYLNGWQRISRIDGNNTPAFGTQLTFSPSPKWVLNSSTYVGNEKPDSARQWRYFHDLYALWYPSKHVAVSAGFDAGAEEMRPNSGKLNFWFSPLLIVRYQLHAWSVTGRAEFYQDRGGVVVPKRAGNPVHLQGYSLNLDRELATNMLWRLEGRWLKNGKPYFLAQDGRLTANHVSFTTSLSFFLKR